MLKKVFVMFIALLTVSQAQVEKKMNELLEKNKAPGMNFSIILPDGTQKDYSSGYADIEEGIKLTPEHSLFSGSIGKTYAIAALATLIDEGKIDVNKKIKEYFTELEWINKLPNINDITVLHLMAHRSGLPRYCFKKEVWETVHSNPDKIWTYEERLSYVFDEKPVHPAGEDFAYSDTGYLLLGMLIEKITGQYLYDAIQQRVLYPAGLIHTYPADKRTLPNHANTYSKIDVFNIHGTVFTDGVCIFNPQLENTGGGFTGRTSDLAKWVKIYFEGQVFSEKSKKLIQSVHSAESEDLFEGESCGAGIFILETKYGPAYGHSGLMAGTRSIMFYFPEIKVAAAFQMNSDKDESGLGLMGHLEELISAFL